MAHQKKVFTRLSLTTLQAEPFLTVMKWLRTQGAV